MWEEKRQNSVRIPLRNTQSSFSSAAAKCGNQWGVMQLKGPEKTVKSKFTPEEDARLQELVAQFGSDNWTAIAQNMDGRTPRQCRERWKHYLSGLDSQTPWTEEEQTLLNKKVEECGWKWGVIARFFPNRTPQTLRNHYEARKKKEWKGYDVQINDTLEERVEYYRRNRPSFPAGFVQQVWQASNPVDMGDGRQMVRDANTPNPIVWDMMSDRFGNFDLGHIFGHEYRRVLDDFANERITEEQFLEEYRNPDNYQIEQSSMNRKHIFEKK